MKLEKIVLLKLNDNKNIPTLPKSMQGDKKVALESEFREGTRDLIRGFDPVLERIILPNMLGLQATDINFPNRAKEYWADFSVIPSKEGIKLNIATEKKDTGEKDENGKAIQVDYPVNAEDFMTYQIAMQSSRVAKTKEDIANLSIFDFYLVDMEEEKAKEASNFDLLEQGDMVYAKLVNEESIEANEEKINCVVEMLRDKTESAIDVESASMLEKKMLLRKARDKDPKLFVTTVEDPYLATKAMIRRMHAYGVISKEGNDYYDGEVNIGAGKVVIGWFTKAENSGKVLALQSRLKQAIELKRN